MIKSIDATNIIRSNLSGYFKMFTSEELYREMNTLRIEDERP